MLEFLQSKQHQQAVILSGMIFTLVVWIFSALSLILAILFTYYFYGIISQTKMVDLQDFCERKINGRLTKIVSAKVNKAIEEEERKRAKADQKAERRGKKLGDVKQLSQRYLIHMMAINFQYTSRPGTPSGNVLQTATFELEKLDQQRPPLGRFGSQWQRGSPQGIPQGPPKMPSAMSDGGFTASPLSYADGRNTPGFPGPQRQNTMDSYGRQIPRSHTPMGPGPAPSMGRRTPFNPTMQNSPNRIMSPASEYGRQTPFNPGFSKSRTFITRSWI
ncbi:hypothetical protein DID88_004534 [Monilinia fructigena]|uniref:Uncharacterized protein n=1 Tax=Monilinia fructigena TaxID=38457 RepID=A0A395IRD2_9HELO|nr:hypothetical protein DID88_004534 [Monilinia fructigena]